MESNNIDPFVSGLFHVAQGLHSSVMWVDWNRAAFQFKAEHYSIVCIDPILFIHFSPNGRVGVYIFDDYEQCHYEH